MESDAEESRVRISSERTLFGTPSRRLWLAEILQRWLVLRLSMRAVRTDRPVGTADDAKLVFWGQE